ncbi:MAG: hypothetical protein ACKVRN_07275 [Pyrinomonadaceae bacterium]
MRSDTTTIGSYTSPFEDGSWERWKNPERFNWLRSLLRQIRESPETFEKALKIDKARIARLAEAVEILESVAHEELAIFEKRMNYMETVQNLLMDNFLKRAPDLRIGLPTKLSAKQPPKGN